MKRKAFYGRGKNISAQNNSKPTNLTPALCRTTSFNHTNSSTSNVGWRSNCVNFLDKYYKKWYEVEHTEVAENNLSIVEKKQSGEVTIFLSMSNKKRKRVYGFPWILLFFSVAGFKIIDSFIFQELVFALRLHFAIMEY